MTTYLALLRKDEGSDFGVEFPDFPGCVTAGRTLEEARCMAAEALGLHIRGMAEDGEPIPEPSSLDAIMADPRNRNAVVTLVDAAARSARFVRVNITLPEDLVQAIDDVTDNRSRFLAEAAEMILHGAQANLSVKSNTSFPNGLRPDETNSDLAEKILANISRMLGEQVQALFDVSRIQPRATGPRPVGQRSSHRRPVPEAERQKK